MDISCIISSGDLEAYVLGQLSEEENLKVAQLAQMFPEIKQEIEEAEAALMRISDEEDAPSDAVRTALFAKLNAMPSATNDSIPVLSNGKDNDHISDTKKSNVISMAPPKRRSNGLLAASVVALLACLGIIGYLVGTNNKYRDETATLRSRADQLEKNTNLKQQQLTAYQSSLQLYQNPAYQKINLVNVPGKPEALVQLFWNKTSHNVYAANVSLPNAPDGKQYQLWALIDGKPVNAGMITGKTLPQKMIDFSKADAFAITLEQAGGSPTPHLDQIFAMGKTS